jgi:hypothetical protein
MKWIIIFFAYSGIADEPDGKIIISDSVVYAFNVEWTIVSHTPINNYGDHIKQGEFKLQHENITAYLIVHWDYVVFIIPGIEGATMRQRTHSHRLCDELYARN